MLLEQAKHMALLVSSPAPKSVFLIKVKHHGERLVCLGLHGLLLAGHSVKVLSCCEAGSHRSTRLLYDGIVAAEWPVQSLLAGHASQVAVLKLFVFQLESLVRTANLL